MGSGSWSREALAGRIACAGAAENEAACCDLAAAARVAHFATIPNAREVDTLISRVD